MDMLHAHRPSSYFVRLNTQSAISVLNFTGETYGAITLRIFNVLLNDLAVSQIRRI